MRVTYVYPAENRKTKRDCSGCLTLKLGCSGSSLISPPSMPNSVKYTIRAHVNLLDGFEVCWKSCVEKTNKS